MDESELSELNISRFAVVNQTLLQLKNEWKSELGAMLREIVEEVMATSRSEDQYLSRKELSHRLNISLPTLSKWTKDGTIRGKYILGGRVRYHWPEVRESLEERRVTE